MDRDWVDAELVFPTLGLMIPRIDDPEAQAAACAIWNDWAWDYTEVLRDRLIPSAMIPCIDFGLALAEVKRVIAKGYAAVTLWEGLNNYNDPRWDPIFAYAAKQGVPLVFHTGVGDINIRALKGPGGALYNYTRQMNDAVDVITQLVAGGVLDRNPGAKVAFIESGASWLVALAERMDEVEVAHANFVRPKLSRPSSQIIDDQVWASFQHDRSCILAAQAGLPGARNVMWGSDYPHAEGTFPISRRIVDELFDGLNVDETTRRNVLGLNAARLFRIEPKVATSATLAAA
jgi:predicted TIM-barrel fold metal-dependent hydrolase